METPKAPRARCTSPARSRGRSTRSIGTEASISIERFLADDLQALGYRWASFTPLFGHLPAWRRDDHFAPAAQAARTQSDDLASGIIGSNLPIAFGARIRAIAKSEVVLWTDVSADHVVQDWKVLQALRVADWAFRLIAFDLHDLVPRSEVDAQ